MLAVPRPAQDSSGRGSCKTGSRVRDDDPLQCDRRIADSRRGHQSSHDAHAATTALPLVNSSPTAQKMQYIAAIGSFFEPQRYDLFARRQKVFAPDRGLFPSAPPSLGGGLFCTENIGVTSLLWVNNETFFSEFLPRY